MTKLTATEKNILCIALYKMRMTNKENLEICKSDAERQDNIEIGKVVDKLIRVFDKPNFELSITEELIG